MTSYSYKPVQEVANSCETGPATNIIYGLALGYKSTCIPSIILALIVFFAYTLQTYHGIALAALGMLSNLPIALSIDCFGPICDNAGGIAEMAELGDNVRTRTDALDSAGNTTAAIGKGFAIGSAFLVGLALYGAYMSQADPYILNIDNTSDRLILSTFLLGAMLPYWFSAMTVKSVG